MAATERVLAAGWKQALAQEAGRAHPRLAVTCTQCCEKGNTTPKVQLKNLAHNSVAEG